MLLKPQGMSITGVGEQQTRKKYERRTVDIGKRKQHKLQEKKMSRKKNLDRDALYQPPRNAACLTGLSLRYIREGCKNGTIPHICVGTDYRVNMKLFLESLDAESRKTVSERV